MARYRRRVSGKFVASAVAAGLILAAAQGHGHPGSGGAAALTAAASARVQRGPGQLDGRLRLRVDRQPERPAWMTCGPRSPRAPGPRP